MVFTKDKSGTGDVSSFAALCTALSATIGTGNIVGVATAIKIGGPGALFWMWLAAVFGMATKYAECLLAVKYRRTDSNGEIATSESVIPPGAESTSNISSFNCALARAATCSTFHTFIKYKNNLPN